jgi:hypothetical protein
MNSLMCARSRIADFVNVLEPASGLEPPTC